MQVPFKIPPCKDCTYLCPGAHVTALAIPLIALSTSARRQNRGVATGVENRTLGSSPIAAKLSYSVVQMTQATNNRAAKAHGRFSTIAAVCSVSPDLSVMLLLPFKPAMALDQMLSVLQYLAAILVCIWRLLAMPSYT